MREAEEKYFANASALHTPGHHAMNQIGECRERLANLIGAHPDEIIFTSGASESNNTVIHTYEGCEIETSAYEHHSLIEAAKFYRGHNLPKLYSCMLANNEIGDLLELPTIDHTKITEKDHVNWSLLDIKNDWGKPLVTDKRHSYLHSDLTQVLGKLPINVNTLGLDYATFSAHKIGGPIGVGALYVRRGAPFRPLIIGGNQENKRRGGTYNTIGIIGFSVALKNIIQNHTYNIYDTCIRNLRDTLAHRILKEIPGSSLNTNLAHSLPNILNVSFHAAEGESIQLYLDAEGIIVSTGSACAAGDTKPSHVLMAKTNDAEVAHSSIRFSFGPDNTISDVNKVMSILPRIISHLQGMSTIDKLDG